MLLDPRLDVTHRPDLALSEYCDRLGETLAGDELVRTLTADAEPFGDLRQPDEVVRHDAGR